MLYAVPGVMIKRVRELLHFHESTAQYNKLSVSVISAIISLPINSTGNDALLAKRMKGHK